MNGESKINLEKTLKQKAHAIQAELTNARCDVGYAIGQAWTVAPDGWEVCVTAHSIADMQRIATEAAAIEAEDRKRRGVGAVKLTPIQRSVLAVLGAQPMTRASIADAIDKEDGDFLQRAIRGLWNVGKTSQHRDGWLRYDA